MDKKTYFYGLYHHGKHSLVKSNRMICFYIGKTTDPIAREEKHTICENPRYVKRAKRGDVGDLKKGRYGEESKYPRYEYMRQHGLNGEWRMKILGSYSINDANEEKELSELVLVTHMLNRGHPLQNMKDGDNNFRGWRRAEHLHSKNVKATRKDIEDFTILEDKVDKQREFIWKKMKERVEEVEDMWRELSIRERELSSKELLFRNEIQREYENAWKEHVEQMTREKAKLDRREKEFNAIVTEWQKNTDEKSKEHIDNVIMHYANELEKEYDEKYENICKQMDEKEKNLEESYFKKVAKLEEKNNELLKRGLELRKSEESLEILKHKAKQRANEKREFIEKYLIDEFFYIAKHMSLEYLHMCYADDDFKSVHPVIRVHILKKEKENRLR